jgi:hypothetical protein
LGFARRNKADLALVVESLGLKPPLFPKARRRLRRTADEKAKGEKLAQNARQGR